MSNFTVADAAVVRATFAPIDAFEGRSATGTATLLGDLEYRADQSSGGHTGFIDGSTGSIPLDEVTVSPPYTWRP